MGNLSYRAPIIIYDVTLAQLPQEVLVVSDDDELEVGVVPSFVDNAGPRNQPVVCIHRVVGGSLYETCCQGFDVLGVQSVGRFI